MYYIFNDYHEYINLETQIQRSLYIVTLFICFCKMPCVYIHRNEDKSNEIKFSKLQAKIYY